MKLPRGRYGAMEGNVVAVGQNAVYEVVHPPELCVDELAWVSGSFGGGFGGGLIGGFVVLLIDRFSIGLIDGLIGRLTGGSVIGLSAGRLTDVSA